MNKGIIKRIIIQSTQNKGLVNGFVHTKSMKVGQHILKGQKKLDNITDIHNNVVL